MDNLTAPKPTATKWVHDLPSYTAIVDKDLKLIDASTGWFKHSNLHRNNALGKCIYDLISNIDQTWEDSFEYALEGVSDIKLIDVNSPRAKSAKSAVWHLNPWKDGYGNIIGLVITIKEEQQNTLLENNLDKINNVLLKDQGGIVASWEYRIDDSSMYWSNEFKNLLGLPKNAKASFKRTFTMIKNDADRNRLRLALRDAVTSGKPWDDNFEVTDHKGNTCLFNIVGRPKFKNGKCTRIIGVVQEIKNKDCNTTQKTNVPSIQYDFFDSVPTGLVLVDLATKKIVKVNNHLLGIFGKTAAAFKNKLIADFVSVEDTVREVIKESLRVRFGFSNIEMAISHKSIGNYSFNVSGNLVNGESGEELLLVSCSDITRASEVQKNFSKKLQKANDEIDKMVHFAHMVSHDLKAHTTNFDLLLNFLNTEEDEAERTSLIQMLFQSTDNLTSTIKGLRELVSIKHHEHAKRKDLLLNEFVYKVIQSNNGVIKQKKAKIHNEISDDFKVKAIPAYLESIIANLVLNGLRFLNENGTPILILNAHIEDGHTVISIEDNSMGINLDKEGDKVFALYKKLKNMGSSTSMGLYLTKYQVELMGGRIEVESAEGEGNVFKIYFPC